MPRRLHRRGFIKILGGAAGATLLMPACGGNGMDMAVGDAGGDGGQPGGFGDFVVPPLLDGVVEGDVRVFRLEMQQGQFEWIAGAPTATYGINGAILGPTLRFR